MAHFYLEPLGIKRNLAKKRSGEKTQPQQETGPIQRKQPLHKSQNDGTASTRQEYENAPSLSHR